MNDHLTLYTYPLQPSFLGKKLGPGEIKCVLRVREQNVSGRGHALTLLIMVMVQSAGICQNLPNRTLGVQFIVSGCPNEAFS